MTLQEWFQDIEKQGAARSGDGCALYDLAVPMLGKRGHSAEARRHSEQAMPGMVQRLGGGQATLVDGNSFYESSRRRSFFFLEHPTLEKIVKRYVRKQGYHHACYYNFLHNIHQDVNKMRENPAKKRLFPFRVGIPICPWQRNKDYKRDAQ